MSERYKVNPNGHVLHVTDYDGPYDWSVWLNTEVQDFDGICLASGSSRSETVASAIETVEAILNQLQQPPKETTNQ